MESTLPPSSQQRSSGVPRSRHSTERLNVSKDGLDVGTPSNQTTVERARPYLLCKVKLNLQHTTENWSAGRSNRNPSSAHVAKLVSSFKNEGIKISDPAHRIFVGTNTPVEFLSRFSEEERAGSVWKGMWQPRDDATTTYQVLDLTNLSKFESLTGQHRKLTLMKSIPEDKLGWAAALGGECLWPFNDARCDTYRPHSKHINFVHVGECCEYPTRHGCTPAKSSKTWRNNRIFQDYSAPQP